MFKDRYDNVLTTSSADARDAYVQALDLMLAGQAGVVEAFRQSVQADPELALGWVGLARAHHYQGDMSAVAQAMEKAVAQDADLTPRETSHINAMGLMFAGKGPAAYQAIRAHVEQFPQDALVAQTCSSVFGLIGFSGQPGREAEMLAFNASLMPHYGDDWWAISQYAFALCETGNLTKADKLIDHALTLNPDNAHGAHVRSHVSYELGDTHGGRAYLADWLSRYDPQGIMFTHLNWHEALWALEQGDIETMWAKVDAAVAPGTAPGGPAINVLTDTASILHRATLAGVTVTPDRWQSVSAFARQAFPKTGNAFIDIHAALAHAMAGETEALDQIIAHPAGPAADLVPDIATGFSHVAAQNWVDAQRSLTRAMADLARIGGSRAQRDLVEQTLATSLINQGKVDEARDIIALRRPVLAGGIAA